MGKLRDVLTNIQKEKVKNRPMPAKSPLIAAEEKRRGNAFFSTTSNSIIPREGIETKSKSPLSESYSIRNTNIGQWSNKRSK
ncbi:MAG: hypothetical protein IPK55_11500 [Streptococcus sp.]|nr:hypothetical protein [Streptococcus sp.]